MKNLRLDMKLTTWPHFTEEMLYFQWISDHPASNELIVWRPMLNVILDVEAPTMVTMEPLRVLSVQLDPDPSPAVGWVSLMWEPVSASIKLVVKCQTQPWAHENIQTRLWHPEKVFVFHSSKMIDDGEPRSKVYGIYNLSLFNFVFSCLSIVSNM